MDSSVVIALNQLKQMKQKIVDSNERKVLAARKSIELGRVSQLLATVLNSTVMHNKF